MKILLQNFDTGLYLGPHGRWTDKPEEGLGFPNTLQASEYTLERRLANTYVVVRASPPPATSSSPKLARARPSRREGGQFARSSVLRDRDPVIANS
jgi:hypothetical protein